MFVAKRNILGDTKQKFWYTEISWWDKSRFDHPGTKSNRSITRNDSKVTSIDAFDLIIGLSQRHAFSPYTRRFKATNRPEYRAHQLPSRMGDRIQFAIFPIRPAFIISPCKKKKKKKERKREGIRRSGRWQKERSSSARDRESFNVKHASIIEHTIVDFKNHLALSIREHWFNLGDHDHETSKTSNHELYSSIESPRVAALPFSYPFISSSSPILLVR